MICVCTYLHNYIVDMCKHQNMQNHHTTHAYKCMHHVYLLLKIHTYKHPALLVCYCTAVLH